MISQFVMQSGKSANRINTARYVGDDMLYRFFKSLTSQANHATRGRNRECRDLQMLFDRFHLAFFTLMVFNTNYYKFETTTTISGTCCWIITLRLSAHNQSRLFIGYTFQSRMCNIQVCQKSGPAIHSIEYTTYFADRFSCNSPSCYR